MLQRTATTLTTTAASCAATRSSRSSGSRTTSTSTSSARWSGRCRQSRRRRRRSPAAKATKALLRAKAVTTTTPAENLRGRNGSRPNPRPRVQGMKARPTSRDPLETNLELQRRVFYWQARAWAIPIPGFDASPATSASLTSPTCWRTRSSTAEGCRHRKTLIRMPPIERSSSWNVWRVSPLFLLNLRPVSKYYGTFNFLFRQDATRIIRR